MSYLDHIKKCNTFTPENYISFIVDGKQLGFVKKSFSKHLLEWSDIFILQDKKVEFHPSVNTSSKVRTTACKPVFEALHERGIIDSWVNELYAVNSSYGKQEKFLMERAAVTFMGVRGYGVHVNGLVKKSDGIYIWIARRTKDKPFWPGMLDQMVAGGQPAGIGRLENVIKESAEEANIPMQIAKTAELVSEIHYRGETHRGMNVDTLFNYDLWLPEDFTPENTDGEVDEFILMSIDEMAYITKNSCDFKDNCNLVNIDLLIRLGVITKTDKNFQEIVEGLYAQL